MSNISEKQDDTLKVILDCDTSTGVLGAEIDDGFAILLCLALQKLDKLKLLGISVVAGNTNVDQAVICTRKILEMTDHGDVPVFKGISTPMVLERKPPCNPDRVIEPLGGNPKVGPQPEHAVDFIIRTVKEFPQEITLIAVGPLMNIAMAIIKAPEIIPLVKEIVAMGGRFGAIAYPGEFNWRFCPHSTRVVLRSGIPMTIIPLDVTVNTSLTLQQLDSLGKSQLVTWLKRASEPFITHQIKGGKAAYLHDPLAVAVAVDRTMATESRELQVDMILEGPWAGITVAQHTESDRKVQVVRQHDNTRFISLYLGALQTLLK